MESMTWFLVAAAVILGISIGLLWWWSRQLRLMVDEMRKVEGVVADVRIRTLRQRYDSFAKLGGYYLLFLLALGTLLAFVLLAFPLVKGRAEQMQKLTEDPKRTERAASRAEQAASRTEQAASKIEGKAARRPFAPPP